MNNTYVLKRKKSRWKIKVLLKNNIYISSYLSNAPSQTWGHDPWLEGEFERRHYDPGLDSGSSTHPVTVTEIWTFVRPPNQSQWFLSALQQVRQSLPATTSHKNNRTY